MHGAGHLQENSGCSEPLEVSGYKFVGCDMAFDLLIDYIPTFPPTLLRHLEVMGLIPMLGISISVSTSSIFCFQFTQPCKKVDCLKII